MGAAPGLALASANASQNNKDTRTAGAAGQLVLAAVAIFTGAFLFFQVQLIVGKYILPWFGGTPAVWNTCIVVFQGLLLGGYCYAHLLASRVARHWQGRVHLLVIGAAATGLAVTSFLWTSPITAGLRWRPQDPNHPIADIISLLLVSVGMPSVVLASTSPLLQTWIGEKSGGAPYRLYALSNLGSLLGLLSYPFLVERLLSVHTQAWLWSAAFILFLAACAGCAVAQMRSQRAEDSLAEVSKAKLEEQPGISVAQQVLWLALPVCSSLLLLSTTNLICQEIAVIPLLWVVPLAVYLISFIVCFDNGRWYRRGIFQFLLAAGAVMSFKALTLLPGTHLLGQIVTFSLTLFFACMICHGELARLKPSSAHLTQYYLLLSAGGVLGSMFVVFLAPRLFTTYWEFQIGISLCAVLMFAAMKIDRASWVNGNYRSQLLPLAATLAAGALCSFYTSVFIIAQMGPLTVFRVRNFFGEKAVIDTDVLLRFRDGAIWHGVQYKDAKRRDEPTLYYHQQTGIGILLDNFPRTPQQPDLRVGLVGLGIGTLAAYGHSGDYYRFYELDPAVIALSGGTQPYFSFVRDSRAKVEIIPGDARISMEREANTGKLQQFDVLVVDAFSSDAIPLHLLTREAMEIYLRQLREPRSVMAFHITNRNLDLRPVLLGLARAEHLHSADVRFDVVDWVLLSRSPEVLNVPAIARQSRSLDDGRLPIVWDDSYSNLYQVLKFRSLDMDTTFRFR